MTILSLKLLKIYNTVFCSGFSSKCMNTCGKMQHLYYSLSSFFYIFEINIPCSLAAGSPYFLSFRIPNRVEDMLDAESSLFSSGFLLEFIPVKTGAGMTTDDLSCFDFDTLRSCRRVVRLLIYIFTYLLRFVKLL